MSAAARGGSARGQGLVDRIWSTFTSPGLALALAAAVALAWLAGSALNPRRLRLAELERALGDRWWWRLYRGLELQDVGGSWWLAVVLVALVLFGLACALEHLPRAVRAAFHPDRLLTPEVERGLRGVSRHPASRDGAAEAARVAGLLRERGFDPRTTAQGEVVHLFAERGRWSRLGPALTGLGLALALAGALVERIWGWSGDVQVPAGGAVEAVVVPTPQGDLRVPLPFAVRVNDLELPLRPDGAPGPFRTNLSLLDRSGGPIPGMQAVDLVEGRLLHMGDIDIAQAGHREDPGGPRAQIALTERGSGRRMTFLVSQGEAVQAGDARYAVMAYTPRYGEIGAAAQIRRVEGERTTEFWVFQARPEFDGKNRPDRFAVEFLGLKKAFVSFLRIRRDPGGRLVQAVGAGLFLAGLLLALLGAHRRVWARVEPGSVTLAGASHRPAARFEVLLASLREALGEAPAPPHRPDRS